MSDFEDPVDIGGDFDNGKLGEIAPQHDERRERPRLKIDRSRPERTVSDLRDILAASGRLYERGMPVRVAFDRTLGGSIAHELNSYDLVLQAHFACRPYAHVRSAKGAWSECDAALPPNIARMYLGWKGEWRLPLLNGVTTAPILSENGGIRTAQGYDPATGLWCEAIPDVADLVPRRPSRSDAEAALWLVRAFFKTFCFADAETHWANGASIVDLRKPPGLDESSFLTSLLGSVCRPSLWLAPGSLFRGAQLSGSGAGKGKLARCVCAVAYGRQPSAVTAGKGDGELEKRIAAALLEGGPAVLFDNFNNTKFESASLESALTERPAKVRQFRTLDLILLNALASIFVTGNGILLARDIVRRFLPTEFDAHMEDPEQRVFEGDIVADAGRRRPKLLAALLTIWRWGRLESHRQGRALGSYEQWCAWARDPLLALGCRDPVERLSETKARDPMRQMIGALFAAWDKHHGSSPQTAHGLDAEVQKIIDPNGRGRQFVAAQLEKLAGARFAGFVLTHHKGPNPREAATYALIRTGDSQLPDLAHDTYDLHGFQVQPSSREHESHETNPSEPGKHPNHAYHAPAMENIYRKNRYSSWGA